MTGLWPYPRLSRQDAKILATCEPNSIVCQNFVNVLNGEEKKIQFSYINQPELPHSRHIISLIGFNWWIIISLKFDHTVKAHLAEYVNDCDWRKWNEKIGCRYGNCYDCGQYDKQVSDYEFVRRGQTHFHGLYILAEAVDDSTRRGGLKKRHAALEYRRQHWAMQWLGRFQQHF